jgi:hypothetical protein
MNLACYMRALRGGGSKKWRALSGKRGGGRGGERKRGRGEEAQRKDERKWCRNGERWRGGGRGNSGKEGSLIFMKRSINFAKDLSTNQN